MHLFDLDDDGIDFTRAIGVPTPTNAPSLSDLNLRCGFRSAVLGFPVMAAIYMAVIAGFFVVACV